MGTTIAFVLLFGSFIGLAYVIGRKIPLLLAFPVEPVHFFEGDLIKKIKARAGDSQIFKLFASREVFLQTLLSKLRIWFLRLETKTNDWLVRLRKNAQEKNEKFTKNYWDQLKKK